jgi:2-oxoglutarate dehydrogenase E1 component
VWVFVSDQKFSFLQRENLPYLEEQLARYQSAPDSVSPELRLFFEGVEFAQRYSGPAASAVANVGGKASDLVNAYRTHGHLLADLDPLKLTQRPAPYLEPSRHGISEAALDQPFGDSSSGSKTLRQVIADLRTIYSGTLTCDVAGCEPEVQSWFQTRFESTEARVKFSVEQKKKILYSLIKTESLEKFIHTRFVGTKRFSIEGGDALMPMMENLVEFGTAMGVKEVVIGMAHRGRVNVLANFMGKAVETIFADFEGRMIDNSGYAGDVKYHLGYSTDKETANGPCHVSLAFNPSHLEFVNPVATGIARAKQRRRNDMVKRETVIPLLIHGDAAFAGQGVVQETLQCSLLEGYRVGGTIHVIINNQVGFTTDPKDARSTRYSSDAAKSIKAPVLLVNGDDVEACVSAMILALKFRQEFHQDVVIDLICYRRFGHNEGDEPAFTQPRMYQVIKDHPTLKTMYADRVAQEGVQSKAETDAIYQEKIDNLQKILEDTRKSPPEFKPMAFGGLWKGLRRGLLKDFDQSFPTPFDEKTLRALGEHLTSRPKNFNLLPKVEKLIETRKDMMEKGMVDWGLGELLSYASLLHEGNPVRISGQDCKRGTFSHRHAVYFDTQTGQEFLPLTQVNPKTEFCIYNSLLSEAAVLGFEYGNAIADPTYLTVWEAQFGDFANGAQVIIDQFLSSGEEKWARMVGLTLLLPHGYEGQGPEHSSARLERFLQLAAHDSMQVCNPTTPANMFHVLRRQMKRDFRKPLIVMTPKSLLRHPKVVSSLKELASGPFQEVLSDPSAADLSGVENLILCSGKVYYDLDKERESRPDLKGRYGILRLEQLAPFPRVQLNPYISGAKKIKRLIWTQEEPENMGAFAYVRPRLRKLLDEIGLEKVAIEYVGRPERSSPAVGSPVVHAKEQQDIVSRSFRF